MEIKSVFGNRIAGNEVFNPSQLLAGQRTESYAESFNPQETEDRGGNSLHLTDKRNWNFRQIEVGFSYKDVEMGRDDRFFLKNRKMKRKAAFTDVEKSARVFAEKGKGLTLDPVSFVTPPLRAPGGLRIQFHGEIFPNLSFCFTGIKVPAVFQHQLPTLGWT